MTKYLIEIKNKDQINIINSQIEYYSDYLDTKDEAAEVAFEENFKENIKIHFKSFYFSFDYQ
ncbi:MAG: hypothetical protein Ta2E_00140 [Mycoplasmoidaceae bacterium]|nr:MAG: hypothetical protein Ta2E_00140 [Mycoplasmoidaceae bacterium]